MQKRNYCFTLNNYTEEEEKQLKEYDAVKYIIFGHEIGENNTPHLQGYMELKRAVRLSTLKKFNKRIHWEDRKGTAKQAADYCRKEDKINLYEKGEMSKQGRRTDLENVAQAILKEKKLIEIAEEYPTTYIKYSKGIKDLKALKDSKNKEWRNVVTEVYYGITGTGKTRKAIEENKDDYYKLDMANNVWFDGYDGQACLIIDDFYGWIKCGHLLNILDGYPLRLEIKGSFTWAKWTKVIITSNNPPDKWYTTITDEQQAAIKRRINNIIEFK